MGSFYVNFAVKGMKQQELADFLRQARIDAFVGPEEDGWCCFADRITSSQDQEEISSRASALSMQPNVMVISVLNHDDDVLSVGLYFGGKLLADFNSCPGYFSDDPSEASLEPQLSQPEEFVKRTSGSDVEAIRDAFLPSDYMEAYELHERIFAVLGLPNYDVGFEFRYASKGDLPIPAYLFVRTGPF